MYCYKYWKWCFWFFEGGSLDFLNNKIKIKVLVIINFKLNILLFYYGLLFDEIVL